MSLHYTRDGYTFRADADGLTIDPGPSYEVAFELSTISPLSTRGGREN
jgi:hypothetical protein